MIMTPPSKPRELDSTIKAITRIEIWLWRAIRGRGLTLANPPLSFYFMLYAGKLCLWSGLHDRAQLSFPRVYPIAIWGGTSKYGTRQSHGRNIPSTPCQCVTLLLFLCTILYFPSVRVISVKLPLQVFMVIAGGRSLKTGEEVFQIMAKISYLLHISAL